MRLEDAKTWWYQLQKHIRLDRKEDVIVMDIDTDPKPYLLKPDGTPRSVLAYLSIGEAEDYRSYWPSLFERKLDKPIIEFENPDWPGNYAVKFWDERWKAILRGMVHAAKAKGFTGLYLDKADVAWDLHKKRPTEYDYHPTLERMAYLIIELATWEPDLDIVLQNCEDVLEYPDVCRVLSATAHEDLLYGDPTDGHRNHHVLTKERLDRAKQFTGRQFAVEYLDDLGLKRRAIKDLSFYGFVPLVRPQDRELAE